MCCIGLVALDSEPEKERESDRIEFSEDCEFNRDRKIIPGSIFLAHDKFCKHIDGSQPADLDLGPENIFSALDLGELEHDRVAGELPRLVRVRM